MTRNGIISILAIMLFGLIFTLATVHAGEGVEGSAKADKLEQCVAPTPDMRRNHFEKILHQRDITVHEGIRSSKDSLSNCVNCHARKDATGASVPVTAPGEFCAGCHSYVAVKIDCFSCHSALPGDK